MIVDREYSPFFGRNNVEVLIRSVVSVIAAAGCEALRGESFVDGQTGARLLIKKTAKQDEGTSFGSLAVFNSEDPRLSAPFSQRVRLYRTVCT